MSKIPVLVVEDEEDIRSGIVDFLDKDRYFVFEAGTGAEAIEKAGSCFDWFEFGIVLLDIKLPDMSGLEVVKKIKQNNSNLYVIMVTAMKDARYAVEAIQNGASNYLTKPFNPNDLLHKMEKASDQAEILRNFFFQHEALSTWRMDLDRRLLLAKEAEEARQREGKGRMNIQEYIDIVHPSADKRLEFGSLGNIEAALKEKMTDISDDTVGGRVLLVDDEEDIRSGLADLLRDRFEVEEASTGKEAIDKFTGSNFDAVVLDIKMPDMSGIDVLKHIAALDKGSFIIMATAMKDLDLTVEAMKSGACDYITKPFTAAEVMAAVERPLKVKKQKDRIETVLNDYKNRAGLSDGALNA